jgi:hypothetical protein
MGTIQHGTPSGYTRHGCRDNCPAPITCRAAYTTYKRDLRWRRNGWDSFDEVAVERACDGDRSVQLSPDEMAAALTILEARGLSARVIAGRLGISQRTVVRWRNGYGVRSRRAAA